MQSNLFDGYAQAFADESFRQPTATQPISMRPVRETMSLTTKKSEMSQAAATLDPLVYLRGRPPEVWLVRVK